MSCASELAGAVLALCGVDAARCYQCGKCSAGCPMAAETAVRPHDTLRRIQRDDDRALRDPSIWLCIGCETCSTRCPNRVEPARAIDALRQLALERRVSGAPRALRAFHDAFLGEIRARGRVHEVGLVARYKLRGVDPLGDVAAAPGLAARGKLSFPSRPIRGRDEVERLFAAFLEAR